MQFEEPIETEGMIILIDMDATIEQLLKAWL